MKYLTVKEALEQIEEARNNPNAIQIDKAALREKIISAAQPKQQKRLPAIGGTNADKG